jgi:hypothetical protein
MNEQTTITANQASAVAADETLTTTASSAKIAAPTKSRRSKNLQAMETDILEDQKLGENLGYQQQSLIRYSAVTNEQQANQYIRDLGLDDMPSIQDPREKALNLYGFYSFLEMQKEAERFVDNFIKCFQLAIFYDDNFVYRYLLAKFFFARGDREPAIQQINDCVAKIKNKETTLYASLAKEVNVKVMKNEINALLIKLNLPTLEDGA